MFEKKWSAELGEHVIRCRTHQQAIGEAEKLIRTSWDPDVTVEGPHSEVTVDIRRAWEGLSDENKEKLKNIRWSGSGFSEKLWRAIALGDTEPVLRHFAHLSSSSTHDFFVDGGELYWRLAYHSARLFAREAVAQILHSPWRR